MLFVENYILKTMQTIIDRLVGRIKCIGNPTAAGLDTLYEYTPSQKKNPSMEYAASAICDYNCAIIDQLKNIIPAVKVQIACYEMLGIAGMTTFLRTIEYARNAGMFVIADGKRNDIGSSAAWYSAAFLGKNNCNNSMPAPFDSDFLTINPYLGIDGVQPFLEDCMQNDKGIFVLVKTSNASSAQLQDRRFADGRTLSQTIADYVEEWGAGMRGSSGYSRVGAVVGATHPHDAALLRERMPHTFFLIPGYGAQGGTGAGIAACFDANGGGCIVNNSRGIVNAHNNPRYKGMTFAAAAYAAAIEMRDDLMKYANNA
jgi:orotidine-5'-phosphate decarboxylase